MGVKKHLFYSVILILLFVTEAANSQTLSITFRNHFGTNARNSYYLLTQPLDGNQALVDSLTNDGSRKVVLRFKPENPEGLYTLLIYYMAGGKNGEARLNILYNKQDIVLSTNIFWAQDSLKIIKSDVNKKYLNFERKQKYYTRYYQKLYELTKFLPPEDTLNTILYKRGKKVIQSLNTLKLNILDSPSKDLATKYLKWKVLATLTNNDVLNNTNYLKKNYLSRFDFTDTVILNLNLINTITSSYLALYKNDSLTFNQQQDRINKAIDILMNYYSVNEELENYVLNKLSKGFKQLGMDKVVLHIDKDFLLPQMCSDPAAEKAMRKQIEEIKKLQPENKAPDFMINQKGIDDLYSIKNDYIILVFWATWCPHCQQSIPEVYNYLNNKKNISVVDIALDNNKTVWEKEIKKYKDWIHIQAVGKWNNPLVKQYAVYATPTIYVLSKNFTIEGKARNYYELIDILKNKKNKNLK